MTDLFDTPETIERGADISPCGRYRYALWRKWGAGGTAMFVGLNPSTADAEVDDPTIRRCVGFARAWGYGGLMMTNLFAWRSTNPRGMMAASDPIGPENDTTLRTVYLNAAVVVAAWGAHGPFKSRDAEVRKQLPRLHYLRLTKGGNPGHPLYLPASLRPVLWN